MQRAFPFFFSLLTVASLVFASASPVEAQEEEARLLFERGNQHLANGMRARGSRRTRALSEALDAYLGVLRLGARTRNVVFNLALTLQELGREAEAFNYYSQYLHEFELSEADRSAGQERLDAIRPRVAVATVTSSPSGAEVRVDRRDLPVRGTTPLELALTPGQHTLFFALDGFEDTTSQVSVVVGQSVPVEATLTGRPVTVQFIAPSGARLLLDGESIEAGRAIPVAPGPHVVRLERPNAPPVDRPFTVRPGADPMDITLGGGGGSAGSARVTLDSNVETQVFLDGLPVGRGSHVELPALPGEHRLRAEAPGMNTATHVFELQENGAIALDVSMGQRVDAGGLNAARGVFGVTAGLSLIAAGISSGVAWDLNEQYEAGIRAQNADGRDEVRLQALHDDVVLNSIVADVFWIAGATLGAVTVLLLIVDPGSDVESSIEVAAQPRAGGGTVALTGRAF